MLRSSDFIEEVQSDYSPKKSLPKENIDIFRSISSIKVLLGQSNSPAASICLAIASITGGTTAFPIMW